MFKKRDLVFFIIILIVFQQSTFGIAKEELKNDFTEKENQMSEDNNISNQENESETIIEPDKIEDSEKNNEESVKPKEKEIPIDEAKDTLIKAKEREKEKSEEDHLDVKKPKDKSKESIENKQSITPKLLGVGLLTDTSLKVTHTTDINKEIIKLEYKGYGVLDLKLLSSTYSIFNLPPEIAQLVEDDKSNIKASYDVPRLGIIVPILRNRGDFKNKDIHIDNNNQIYLNFIEFLSLSLLSRTNYNFTLEIELNELPPRDDGLYVFHSQVTNSLVDLSLLSGENVATAELVAPYPPPNPPKIDEPIYPSDTIVTGTGKPNSEIILTINHEEYRGSTDENGEFTIDIPQQIAGTVVAGVIIDERDVISDIIEVIIQQGTLTFHKVPETLLFESTSIKSGTVTIPRKNSDWTIQIKDTRGEGSPWQLFAQMEEPLKSEKSQHILENALVFVDSESPSQSLANKVKVFDGITDLNTITNIQWEPNQGPLLELDPIHALAESYSTNIRWTLMDAP